MTLSTRAARRAPSSRLVGIAFHPVKHPAFAALHADLISRAHKERIIMFETISRALLSICAIAVSSLSIWELREVGIMAPAMVLIIQLLVILVLVAVLLILWFRNLDPQRIRAGSDVKAFSAATESAARSSQAKFLASQMQEAAFTRQIDQLASNASQITEKLDNLGKAIDDKFNDLKDRVVAIEGRFSISDPATVAALRELASAISALRTPNDQHVGRERPLS
jgi:uncharacterized membrane protein